MTNITFYRKNKDIIRFVAENHAEYAEEGADIVCAAVSALAMHTLNTLTEVLGLQVGFEVREAYLECILPADMKAEDAEHAKVLLDALYLSLDNLQKQYETYITITELEV